MKKLLLPLVIIAGLGLYYFSGNEDKSQNAADDLKATKESKLTRKLKIYRKKLV
jgi:hypothetical protein